jgi:hypothetical protein
MAIQVRRGKEADLDVSKALPGEWLVSTDTKYVRMCFAPGVVVRMATYDAFEADSQRIIAELTDVLAEVKTVGDAVKTIQSYVKNAEVVVENYAKSAKEYSELAGTYADNAKTSESNAANSAASAEASADLASSSYHQAYDAQRKASAAASSAMMNANTAFEYMSATLTYASNADLKANEATNAADVATQKVEDIEESVAIATEKAQAAARSEENAKMYSERAQAVADIGLAEKNKLGLIMGGDNYIDDNGTLVLTKQTTDKTMYNSNTGGALFHEIGGNTEQRTTTGKNLLMSTVTTHTVNGVTFTVSKDGSMAVKGIASATIDEIIGQVSLVTGTVYRLVGFQGSGIQNKYALYVNDGVSYPNDIGKGVTFTAKTTAAPYVRLTIPSGQSVDMLLKPMISLNISDTYDTWEPYTGKKPSPNPDYLQVIKPVRGKNLLDCRGLEGNGYVNLKDGTEILTTPVYDSNGNLMYVEVNGSFTEDGNYYYILEEQFEFVKGNSYILSGSPGSDNNSSCCLYVQHEDGQCELDGGKGLEINPVENLSLTVGICVKTGYTADHIRFYPMIRPASIKDDTYVPYGCLRVKASGKNLINQLCVAANTQLSKKHYLKAGVYSATRESSESGNNWYIGAFDISKNTITKTSIVISGWSLNADNNYYYGGADSDTVTFTLNNDCYVEIASLNGSGTTYLTLVEGDKPSTCTPYQEKSIILSNITLNGHNGVQDRIVRKDGVWGIEGNIFSGVITSSNAIMGIAVNRRFQIALPHLGFPKASSLGYAKGIWLSNKFSCMSMEKARETTEENIICGNNDFVYLRVTDNTTEEELRQILESGVEISYVVAEPTFEPLPTADQIALNSLVSFDGVTYLSFDSEIEPTSLVEYGTSKVGAYTLEVWNKEENNRIRIEEVTTAMLALNQE